MSLIRYQNSDYYTNILNSVKANTSNNIAILARKNKEVLSIYSMLVSDNIKARYIADNNSFRLGNLVELTDVLQNWRETEDFEKSRNNSDTIYGKSNNNALKNAVLDKFEDEYQAEIKKSQQHFIGVFEQYLHKITFDEFELGKSKVTVSTIHKAKGKEWDEVYICAQDDFISTNPQQAQYDKRLAYVAITRAKNSLYIHSKITLFDGFIDYFDEHNICNTQFEPLKTIVLLMGLDDIVLTYSYSQEGIAKSSPLAGEVVDVIDKQQYITIAKDNNQIASLSQKMIEKIRDENGYRLNNKAEIENVVEWVNKEDGKKYKQVLCKIYLSKEH